MNFDLQTALESAMARVSEWIEAAITSLPNLVAAVIILVVFWLLAKGARRLLSRVLERVSDYRAVNRLLSTMLFILVVGLGTLIALGALNLDKTVTSVLAGAGILGLAVGFAAQDTVENLIAGILLSVRRPFREGQLISTGDNVGVVDEINLRATVLRTASGQHVFIPNKEVFGNALTNYSALGSRRVDLNCGVSYADDLDEVRRVAIRAMEDVSGREPERDIDFYYEEFGGSSINFVVRFWIPFSQSHADYLGARSEAVVRLKKAFDESGISIPFPIRTLDFGILGGVPLQEQLGGRT